ncbi:hypothetical protein T4B_4094 [Trichinella pseudospiralis]|uniref:Uncharacterized protein n=1 Tax=Trichinella pseudospiralis TaxID=6337 RepID=A0A0V1DLN9_TRIPS|nr:hypothetical protein T4A_12446 [Trichinella pseudospiralis]KRY62697.1 hypothetical protein T4A_9972 [Trichinella pseudospiralis]KRY96988.1 hypothetical protein T4B_3409 [Trichinella pseudospiralis]KRY97093.1 hypothetical protein T4B_4094 [Trichinella pseudospiralis]
MVVRILPLRVWFTQFAMECVANDLMLIAGRS